MTKSSAEHAPRTSFACQHRSQSTKPYRQAQGFTLIELVCVIVILGILSATAIPRFSDLSREARIAKLNAMAGALHSAAQLWNAVCLLQTQSNCLTGDTAIIRNGVSVAMFHGYPNAGDNLGGNQIDTLITSSGFTITRPSAYYTRFAVGNAPNPDKCAVTYCENNGERGLKDYCSATSYRVAIFTDGCG